MGDWIWVLITAAITFLGLAFINVTTADESAPLAMGIAWSGSISQHTATTQSQSDNSTPESSLAAPSSSSSQRADLPSAVVGSTSKPSPQSFLPSNPLPMGIALVVFIIVIFRLWHSMRMSRTRPAGT